MSTVFLAWPRRRGEIVLGSDVRCTRGEFDTRPFPVASLALVSPGAATDGVIPIIPEKMTTILVIAVCKVITF